MQHLEQDGDLPGTAGPDATFEADLLAYDEALAAGSSAGVMTAPAETAASEHIARARSCLDRLERDRRDSTTDAAAELVRLLYAEGLIAQGALQEAPFGRFRLVRELGRGGCGIVFLAWDPALRRHVALKIPRLDVLLRPESRQRFVREGRAAAGLEHPNIINVLEAGEVGAVCYIASVYCPGPTLAQWLKGQKTLVPVSAAVDLLATVADAIQHAHERGVVHRDLKPSNILLEPDEPGCRFPEDPGAQGAAQSALPLSKFIPKVADFGLAKRVFTAGPGSTFSQSQTPSESLTRSGNVLGTPGYMAPEQATGRADDAGPATDVYALGVVLYEMLTDHSPFRGANEAQTLLQIIAADPVAPRSLRSDIPRDVEIICLKCLHCLPERRYASMAALAEDLRRWRRGEPIEARPASAFERGRLWARRRPAAAALLAAGMTAFVGLWVGMLWHFAQLDAKNTDLQAALKKADLERERAEKGETAARGRAYAAQINLADQFRDSGRPGLLRDLLNHLRPAPGESDLRGFEWHFLWNAGRRETYLPTQGRCVNSVSYLGAGREFVSVDDKGAVMVWDAEQVRLLSRWDNHPVRAGDQVFSADGSRFVSISSDRESCQVRLCDLAARQDLATKSWPSREAYCAILSPDGRTVAIRGQWEQDEGGKVRLWDSKTGDVRLLWRRSATNITHFVFSPDSSTLAIAYHLGGAAAIECIDVVSGTRKGRVLKGHPGNILGLAFSPDGRELASACKGQAVKVWDLAAGREKWTLHGHKEPVCALAYSPDGAWLGGGTSPVKGPQSNCSVCVWDLTKDGALHAPPFHIGITVDCLAFSAKGRTLLLGDHDRRVCLYDFDAEPATSVFKGHGPAEAWSVAFAPDGATLISGGDDHCVRHWNVRTGEQIEVFPGHGSLVTAVAVSRDGKRWASASYDQSVKVWDAVSGKCLHTLAHPDRVWAVAFTPSGDALVASGVDGSITLWATETGKLLREFPKHGSRVRCAFAPDGTLATCSNDGTVKLWNVDDGVCLTTFREASKALSLEFSPDGALLALATADGVVSLRPADGGAPVLVLQGHAQGVRKLAFAPDSKTLATGSLDRTVRLWHVATGQELVCFKDLEHQINSVAFARDGSALAAALHDGTIHLWKAPR